MVQLNRFSSQIIHPKREIVKKIIIFAVVVTTSRACYKVAILQKATLSLSPAFPVTLSCIPNHDPEFRRHVLTLPALAVVVVHWCAHCVMWVVESGDNKLGLEYKHDGVDECQATHLNERGTFLNERSAG